MAATVTSEHADAAVWTLHPELARLNRALRRADGFALYLAICDSPRYQEKLTTILRREVSRPIFDVELDEMSFISVEEAIDNASRVAPADAVLFVFGFDKLLRVDDPLRQTVLLETHSYRYLTLRELNWRREVFARIGHPIVLWLSKHSAYLISNYAPDFYDWYSGQYEFKLPRDVFVDCAKERLTAKILGDSRLVEPGLEMSLEFLQRVHTPLLRIEPSAVLASWYADLADKTAASKWIGVSQDSLKQVLSSENELERFMAASLESLLPIARALRALGRTHRTKHWLEKSHDDDRLSVLDRVMIGIEAIEHVFASSANQPTERRFEVCVEYLGILIDEGRTAAAIDFAVQAVWLAETYLGDDHPLTSVLRMETARIYITLSDPEQASRLIDSAASTIGFPVNLDEMDSADSYPPLIQKLCPDDLFKALKLIDPSERLTVLSHRLLLYRPACRQVLAAYYLEGLDLSEIAQVLNRSYTIVCSLMAQALTQLGRELQ